MSEKKLINPFDNVTSKQVSQRQIKSCVTELDKLEQKLKTVAINTVPDPGIMEQIANLKKSAHEIINNLDILVQEQARNNEHDPNVIPDPEPILDYTKEPGYEEDEPDDDEGFDGDIDDLIEYYNNH